MRLKRLGLTVVIGIVIGICAVDSPMKMSTPVYGAPANFYWVLPNELAGMGYPRTASNLRYLDQIGIRHLVTLSPEMRPPFHNVSDVQVRSHNIFIEEFEAPTLDQIQDFVHICQNARTLQEPVGVHCRQGRGRTGTMLACYLVKFKGMSPDAAMNRVRTLMPGSIETYSQENAIREYRDSLH